MDYVCACSSCTQNEQPSPQFHVNEMSGGAVFPIAPVTTGDASSLLSGNEWSGSELKYHFYNEKPDYTYAYASANPGFQEFNDMMKGVARDALQMIENYTNLTITEVEPSQSAELAFGRHDMEGGYGGYAWYPGGSLWSGDTWVEDDSDNPLRGSSDYNLIMHEIGHAMGLKHAADNPNPVDPAYDSHLYSLMSGPNGGLTGNPVSYMILDIAAFQAMYGTNWDYNSGDTIYAIDYRTSYTIWDGGGKDALDFGAFSEAVSINLNDGEHSFYSTAGALGAQTYAVGIALNAVIENSTGGSGNDTITGNEANNVLNGGAGNDTISGGSGGDAIDGGAGQDVIYGGGGNDWIWGQAGSDVISGEGGTDLIHGGDGNDIISGGDGNDYIAGAGGADWLLGGAGDDVFVFQDHSDSVDTARDTLEFVQGEDLINVSALGFTGVQGLYAVGNVLGYLPLWGSTYVYSDISDFAFKISGEINLTDADFIFA